MTTRHAFLFACAIKILLVFLPSYVFVGEDKGKKKSGGFGSEYFPFLQKCKPSTSTGSV